MEKIVNADARLKTGCQQLDAFVLSVQKLYKKHDFEFKKDNKLRVLDCTPIRIELFKLNYEDEKFDLYKEANAAESLQCILEILHGWLTCIRDKAKPTDITDATDTVCKNDKDDQCFIHEQFYV